LRRRYRLGRPWPVSPVASSYDDSGRVDIDPLPRLGIEISPCEPLVSGTSRGAVTPEQCGHRRATSTVLEPIRTAHVLADKVISPVLARLGVRAVLASVQTLLRASNDCVRVPGRARLGDNRNMIATRHRGSDSYPRTTDRPTKRQAGNRQRNEPTHNIPFPCPRTQPQCLRDTTGATTARQP
jgi:hypothetical protein